MNTVIQILVIPFILVVVSESTASSYRTWNQKGWRYKKMVKADILRYKQMLDSCNHFPISYACRLPANSFNLKCIPSTQRCDGHFDCPYGDDEEGCPEVCPDGNVCCPNGGCAAVCDGTAQCTNGEDEHECSPKVDNCPSGYIRCPSGKCATMCDGVVECNETFDCKDDEINCRTTCPTGNIVCNTPGMCGVPCSDTLDCPDKVDEKYCYLECDKDEIGCESRNDGKSLCAPLCPEEPQCLLDKDKLPEHCGECYVAGSPPSCVKAFGD